MSTATAFPMRRTVEARDARESGKLAERAPSFSWYHNGIDLPVIRAIAKRAGKGWEDGVFHRGGIHTGSWFVCGNKTGMRIRTILELYANEADFLEDTL